MPQKGYILKTAWVALIFLLGLTSTAWSEPGSVTRADGSEICFYLDRPSRDNYPLVVILQGSECLKVSHKYLDMVESLKARGVAVLRVEKPGLSDATPIGDCPPEYLLLNTPQRRVLDLLSVLGELRRTDQGYNGSVALMGGSEGALIAAMTAPLCPDLAAVVLLSGGGGGIFGQEVLGSVRMHMVSTGAPEEAIEARLNEMRSQMDEIRKEPVPGKEWLSDGELARSTYLWWASAWDLQLSLPLLNVDQPILAWQGESDQSVPMHSGQGLAEKMKAAGRHNFELRTYQGGHAPTDKVLTESLDWICQKLVQSKR